MTTGSVERIDFPAVLQASVQIVPAVGHCFNSHRDNLGSWTGIDMWLSEMLARR